MSDEKAVADEVNGATGVAEIVGGYLHTYTRKQATEDGVLVDVSEMAAECGIKWPMAVTREVWERYVCVPAGLEITQNLRGRLKDLVFMCGWAIRSGRMGGVTGTFSVLFLIPADTEWLPNEKRHGGTCVVRDRKVGLRLVTLKAVSGPDDDGSPCISIMMLDQD